MRTIRLGDIPTIKQGNKLFSLSELIGKPIVANETTIAYKFPSENSKIYFTPEDFKSKGANGYAIEQINVYVNNGTFGTNEPLLYKVGKGADLGTYSLSSSARYYFKNSNSPSGSVFINMSEDKDAQGYRKPVFVFGGMLAIDNVYDTINKGKLIGTLDTWVSGKDMIKIHKGAYIYNKNTEIFLSFKSGNKNFYVPLKPKTIDIKVIEKSGGKDEETKQEEQEEKDKPFYEKIADNLTSGLKKVVIIGGIAFLVYKIGTFAISETLKNKKNDN